MKDVDIPSIHRSRLGVNDETSKCRRGASGRPAKASFLHNLFTSVTKSAMEEYHCKINR